MTFKAENESMKCVKKEEEEEEEKKKNCIQMRWLYAIVDTSNKLNETLDIRWT
jgi:hypothetical protein